LRIVAIIQARIGSTRLPGKVLLALAGKPMLAHDLNRVHRAHTLHEIVVATTDQPADDRVAGLCTQLGFPCFRGSEADVLDRYYKAAVESKADAIVRVTSDCPLIDPEIIDLVTEDFLSGQPLVQYVNTAIPKNTYPRGLDVEIARFDVLERAWLEDKNPAWREHVTPYIYRHPELFCIRGVCSDTDYSHLRWTVDTPEDFELVKRIYEHFGHNHFGWREVLDVLKQNPEWIEINRNVVQKQVE
jgi:spore coat polysaccharide biosynthesis protein SpsF